MNKAGPGFTRPMCDLLAKNLNDLFVSNARMSAPFECVLSSAVGGSGGSYVVSGSAYDADAGASFMANFAASSYVRVLARIHNLTCGDMFEASDTCNGGTHTYDSRNVLAD
eukprot:127600-Chlamydomonas_euryale.AAC.1